MEYCAAPDKAPACCPKCGSDGVQWSKKYRSASYNPHYGEHVENICPVCGFCLKTAILGETGYYQMSQQESAKWWADSWARINSGRYDI